MDIKNLIPSITLQGTTYPAALNMMALEEFCEQENISLSEIDVYLSNGSISKMITLFHFMLSYGHRVSGLEFVLSVDQVAQLVGFDIEGVAQLIAQCMPEVEEVSPKKGKRKK